MPSAADIKHEDRFLRNTCGDEVDMPIMKKHIDTGGGKIKWNIFNDFSKGVGREIFYQDRNIGQAVATSTSMRGSDV